MLCAAQSAGAPGAPSLVTTNLSLDWTARRRRLRTVRSASVSLVR